MNILFQSATSSNHNISVNEATEIYQCLVTQHLNPTRITAKDPNYKDILNQLQQEVSTMIFKGNWDEWKKHPPELLQGKVNEHQNPAEDMAIDPNFWDISYSVTEMDQSTNEVPHRKDWIVLMKLDKMKICAIKNQKCFHRGQIDMERKPACQRRKCCPR